MKYYSNKSEYSHLLHEFLAKRNLRLNLIFKVLFIYFSYKAQNQ